jgi:hypothetical protein
MPVPSRLNVRSKLLMFFAFSLLGAIDVEAFLS